MDHYATCDQQWLIDNGKNGHPLSANAVAALLDYTPVDYTTVTAQVSKEYILQCYSADNLIWYRNISLLQIDGNLYWLHCATYHPDPLPTEYAVCPLQESLSMLLLAELSN